MIEGIRRDPDSRRHVVSAWNVADLPAMALAPCHALFQFYVADGRLSCQLYQRSADLFLGAPVQHRLVRAADAHGRAGDRPRAGRLRAHARGRAPLLNHVDQAREQLSREPRALPTLELDPACRSIDDFAFDSITVVGYDPHPAIRAPIAV